MRPSVSTNVVAISKTTLGLVRKIHDVRPNVKERGFELLFLQEVVEDIVRAIRTIIKSQTPSVWLRALVNVLGNVLVFGLLAFRGCPPTVRVLVIIVLVCISVYLLVRLVDAWLHLDIFGDHI